MENSDDLNRENAYVCAPLVNGHVIIFREGKHRSIKTVSLAKAWGKTLLMQGFGKLDDIEKLPPPHFAVLSLK